MFAECAFVCLSEMHECVTTGYCTSGKVVNIFFHKIVRVENYTKVLLHSLDCKIPFAVKCCIFPHSILVDLSISSLPVFYSFPWVL